MLLEVGFGLLQLFESWNSFCALYSSSGSRREGHEMGRAGQQTLFVLDKNYPGCKTGVIPNGVDTCFISFCPWQLTKARMYQVRRLISICI